MRFANSRPPGISTTSTSQPSPASTKNSYGNSQQAPTSTDATNVLFIGPPGVGKTMLAVILGRAAVDGGHRVYYTTALT